MWIVSFSLLYFYISSQICGKTYLAKHKNKTVILEVTKEAENQGKDYQFNVTIHSRSKCAKKGEIKQALVVGCGGTIEIECESGCLEIHKVLYTCNERNESLASQERIVNRKCKGKENVL